ncbi:MAG: hypothetical protein J0L94_00115 [Rhodothermia bacterium]|nr:hypothetical protein [Rhodothermia bacterium]
MKNILYPKLGLMALFFLVLSAGVAAAQPALTEAKIATLRQQHQGFILGRGTIDAADKAELTSLLKGVNPSQYFIRFSDGSTIGKKNMGLSEVKAVSKIRRPGDLQGMTFITRDPGYVFIYKSDMKSFESVVGQAKAQKIQSILVKYQ